MRRTRDLNTLKAVGRPGSANHPADASVNTSSSQAEYQWQNGAPDLSEGDNVEVSLTVSSGD